jgi:hypothetical protein
MFHDATQRACPMRAHPGSTIITDKTVAFRTMETPFLVTFRIPLRSKIAIFFDGIAILGSVAQVFQEYKLRPTDKYCTHSRARLVDEFDRLPSRLEENSGCDATS